VHRRRRTSLLAAAAIVAVLAAGCGGPNTYSSGGVTFQYPHGWKTVLPPATTPGQTGLTTRVGVGLDAANVVIVVSSQLAQAIGAQDAASTEQGVIQALSTSAKQRGATVQGPSAATLGGFDGLGLTIVGLPVGGQTVDSRVIVMINGDVEYLLNCQATDANAEELGKGCAQVIQTFSLS
jgi:hypothetical protein